ncbi:MAG: hypothetical protein O6942_10165, partial [Bacteroidetes bacterium]|nr:hypothetical protein [Bacteroidota bacterium]
KVRVISACVSAFPNRITARMYDRLQNVPMTPGFVQGESVLVGMSICTDSFSRVLVKHSLPRCGRGNRRRSTAFSANASSFFASVNAE